MANKLDLKTLLAEHKNSTNPKLVQKKTFLKKKRSLAILGASFTFLALVGGLIGYNLTPQKTASAAGSVWVSPPTEVVSFWGSPPTEGGVVTSVGQQAGGLGQTGCQNRAANPPSCNQCASGDSFTQLVGGWSVCYSPEQAGIYNQVRALVGDNMMTGMGGNGTSRPNNDQSGVVISVGQQWGGGNTQNNQTFGSTSSTSLPTIACRNQAINFPTCNQCAKGQELITKGDFSYCGLPQRPQANNPQPGLQNAQASSSSNSVGNPGLPPLPVNPGFPTQSSSSSITSVSSQNNSLPGLPPTPNLPPFQGSSSSANSSQNSSTPPFQGVVELNISENNIKFTPERFQPEKRGNSDIKVVVSNLKYLPNGYTCSFDYKSYPAFSNKNPTVANFASNVQKDSSGNFTATLPKTRQLFSVILIDVFCSGQGNTSNQGFDIAYRGSTTYNFRVGALAQTEAKGEAN